MTHRSLVATILCEVSQHGLAWSNNTGALKDQTGRMVRYGLNGSSDVLACIRGRMIGIEAKVGRDQVRPNQQRFAKALTDAGGLYIVARSVDDVTNALKLEGLIQ